MNWNKFFFAGAAFVLLAALVLHQGRVASPVGGDHGMLSGTALLDPAAAATQNRTADAAETERDCTAHSDAKPSAGHACVDSRDEKRLAQNDPPK